MHFIWALLLRRNRIANGSCSVNTKNTELQKINCEMKNFDSEMLHIDLVKRDTQDQPQTLDSGSSTHTSPCVVGGIRHYFFSVGGYANPKFNGFTVELVE